MSDFRLIGARRMAHNKEAWREPATLGFYTRLLQKIIANEDESPVDRAEAAYLIKKLYAAEKRPPVA